MSDMDADPREEAPIPGEVTSAPKAERNRERKTAPVRKKRLTAEMRKFAVQLLEKRADARSLAQTLGVTTRSLQKWAEQSRRATPPARLGRRPHDQGRLASTERAIDEIQRKSPRPLSWRAARLALGKEYPTRLIQRVVCVRKRARQRAHRMALEDQRVHLEILQCGVVWALDATHLDRTEHGVAIQAEVLSDTASSSLIAAAAGPPASDPQVATLLEAAFVKHGAPLMVQSDNGGENSGPAVRALLERYQVIHLRNVPHTPQHNPSAERANGLLKETLGIRRGDPPRRLSCDDWQTRLDLARNWMNSSFPRPSRDGKTPLDFHAALPSWYAAFSREDFYAAARSAVEHAVKSTENPRMRRRAVRAAILDTMESFGILRRTRGRARIPIPKCEGIS